MIQLCLNKLQKKTDQRFGYFILFMKLKHEAPISVTSKLSVDFFFSHTSQKSILKQRFLNWQVLD